MSAVTVLLTSGQKTFSTDELPITVGGPDCDVIIGGESAHGPTAFVAYDDGHFFVQPAPEAAQPPTLNGLALSASTWLDDGDTLVVSGETARCAVAGGSLTLDFTEAPRPRPKPEVTRPSSPPPSGDLVITPTPFEPRWQQPPPRRRLRVPLQAFAAAAVLAVLAVGAWFVLSARAIRIETVPDGARVTITGGLSIEIGGRHLVRPGRYVALAEHPGHLDLEAPLEISATTPATVRLELEPLGTELSLTTRPIDGARIAIDGAVIGTSPISRHPLAAGSHVIEVSAPRHLPAQRQLDVAPGDPPLELDIELEPDWAPVRVASDPTGASMVLDGQQVGSTPATIEVGSGERLLELRARGFKLHRQRLRVVTGQPLDLGTIRLEPLDGILVVSSDPTPASIAVDGEYRGMTPIEIAVPPNAEREVRITRAGYATFQTRIRVAPGERATVAADLERLMGEVVITSQPPGAEIVVDGLSLGTTEQRLELEARAHEIVVRLQGYRPFTTTITPQPGLTSAVHAELRQEGPAGLPQSATTPQGADLVLVPPARFTMGAPRREPGRRSNEVLREVEISRAFYIAVREVSNREYREFRPGHRSGAHAGQNLEIDHHPVVRVTWEDAARYCNWLSEQAGLPPVYVEHGSTLESRRPLPLGYRLPTEAEWAAAARFSDTSGGRKYIWGDALPVPADAGNYGDESIADELGAAVPGYRDGYRGTAPVGSFRANPLGIFDLGGNVSEWVHDLYAVTPSPPSTVESDPLGPTRGPGHVIRGASWTSTSVTELRLSTRDVGDGAYPDVGFRVARTAP